MNIIYGSIKAEIIYRELLMLLLSFKYNKYPFEFLIEDLCMRLIWNICIFRSTHEYIFRDLYNYLTLIWPKKSILESCHLSPSHLEYLSQLKFNYIGFQKLIFAPIYIKIIQKFLSFVVLCMSYSISDTCFLFKL